MVSSSTGVCSWLRDAPGRVSSVMVPASMASWTEPTTRRADSCAARASRNSITSGKLWPVSMCTSGKGSFAGQNAFSATRSMTIESLPPENSSAGRSNSAATSRKIWIASDSSVCRWVSS